MWKCFSNCLLTHSTGKGDILSLLPQYGLLRKKIFEQITLIFEQITLIFEQITFSIIFKLSLTSSSSSVLYNLSLHPPGSCTAHLKIIFRKFDLNLNSKFKPANHFQNFDLNLNSKKIIFMRCVELFRVSKCFMLNKLRWAVTSTFLADNNFEI